MIRRALAAAAWAIAAPVAVAKVAVPELPEPLLADVRRVLSEGQVAGGAIVLVDASGPTAAHWFGFADVERGEKVGPATCFRAGSVSKLATALLAHRLAAAGVVALHAPLPQRLRPPAPAQCREPPTLAQLLEHTGGVAGSSHADYGAQQPNAPVAAIASRIARQPLRWCPGLHYSYSNNGTTLAAAALEVATGQDFDSLMRQHLFDPLAMAGASFAVTPWPTCLSRSYQSDGRTPVAPWQLPVRPAGALMATPVDLARLVEHLLREPALAGSMARASTGLAARAGATDVYAQGLFAFVAAGGLLVGHWGRIDGFQTTLGFEPRLGRGMVIVVNTADRRTMARLREAVAAHLFGLAPRELPPPPARPAAGIDGWYANRTHDMVLRAPWVELFDVVRIRSHETGLQIRGIWPWAEPTNVVATGPTSFRAEKLPVATMAFATFDATRWWIDNESYASVHPAWALSRAAVAIGGLATVMILPPALAVVALVGARRRAVLRGALRSPWAWLLLAAIAWWTVLGGYVAAGLYGVGASLAALGRPSWLSLALTAASVVAPLATAAALWVQRRRLDPLPLAIAAVLALFALLVWGLGWIPLVTFAE